MTLSPVQKKLAIPVAFILLLIILNPSIRQFKEFEGEGGRRFYSPSLRRESNFLLFSIYKADDIRYLGFCMNFIRL